MLSDKLESLSVKKKYNLKISLYIVFLHIHVNLNDIIVRKLNKIKRRLFD